MKDQLRNAVPPAAQCPSCGEPTKTAPSASRDWSCTCQDFARFLAHCGGNRVETFDDYRFVAQAVYALMGPTYGWRRGQTYENVLTSLFPSMGRNVPREVDPFHVPDTQGFATFYEWVDKHWEQRLMSRMYLTNIGQRLLKKSENGEAPTIEETMEFAKVAHEGQVDKAGKPYIDHPLAVAAIVSMLQVQQGAFDEVEPEHERAAACLHDVVEDTDVTLTDLQTFGFPQPVVDMVGLLTKDKSVEGTYMDKIHGLVASGNRGALRVKLADLTHNSLPERIAQLPPELRGIKGRYDKAKRVVGEGLKNWSREVAG